MAANLNNVGGAGGFQTAVLIADGVLNYPGTTNGIAGVTTLANFTQITGGSPVVTVPIAAALEIQSIVGGLILPRMTTTQRNAMNKPNASINPTALGPGLMIYNLTTNTVDVYTGTAWNSFGAGDITGPGSSTDKALAIWNGTTGNALSNSTITLTTSGSDSILGTTPTNSTLALQANGTGLVAILATSGTSSNGSLSIQATDGSFFTMVAQTGTPVLNYLLPNTTPTVNQGLVVTNIAGSNVTLGWGVPTLSFVQVTLSSADLLALQGTPITVLPTPGPGLINLPQFAQFYYTFNTTPYTIPDAADGFKFALGGQDISPTTTPGTGFIDQGSNMIVGAPVYFFDIILNEATSTNANVTVFNPGPSNFTLGDGTVTIILAYRTFPAL